MPRLAKNNQTRTEKAENAEKRTYTTRTQIKAVDELLRKNFAGLPDEAIAEVSAKVSGYVLGGEKYTTWDQVEKCLENFFWSDAEDAEGKTANTLEAQSCASCAELEKLLAEIQALKEDATMSRQKLKATESDYSTKFNNVLDEREKNLQKISALEAEKKELADKAASYAKELEEKRTALALMKRNLDNSAELQNACTQAELSLADAEQARKEAEEKEKKARGELINCQGRISELEGRLKQYEGTMDGSESAGNSSKSQLKKTINELREENRGLNVQLSREKEAKEKAIDEITALKYSYNSKQVEKLQKEKADAYELYEMASADLDALTEEKKKLEADLSTLRTDLAAEKRNSEVLKKSLNAKERANASGGIFSNDGSLFYDEEMADFIRLLAERNAERLEGGKDIYKREYDLSKKIVDSIEKSGWQEKMRERLDNAAKAEDIRAFQRLGFEDAGGSKHDKLFYHGDPRYMLIASVTPSDGNSWKACSCQAKTFLLFGQKGAEKGEERA